MGIIDFAISWRRTLSVIITMGVGTAAYLVKFDRADSGMCEKAAQNLARLYNEEHGGKSGVLSSDAATLAENTFSACQRTYSNKEAKCMANARTYKEAKACKMGSGI